MSEQQQASLEGAIIARANLDGQLTGDRFARSRLASARHDLQEHLAALRWTAFIEDHQASAYRARFTARHKTRRYGHA